MWKAPDVLVVHLKRFSNRGSYRDKIDTFVDFPVSGFDLEPRVLERQLSKRLAAEGVDTQELGLDDIKEPLLYDLFAVDEHMGGLGGGHYRAYAQNHINGDWYHFDDSRVMKAKAEESVVSAILQLNLMLLTTLVFRTPTHICYSINVVLVDL